MVKFFSIVFLLLTASASSAQQARQPSAIEQALSNKLTVEMNSTLQCSVSLIDTERKLVEATSRINMLEEKYEPKPPMSK